MKPRHKFLIGAGLVVVSSGWLMYSSISETGMYYVTPTELTAKLASDPSLHGVGIKMGARVVPGSIKRAAGERDGRRPRCHEQRDPQRQLADENQARGPPLAADL